MLIEGPILQEEDLNFPAGTLTMVSGVSTSAAASEEEMMVNIEENIKLKLPILEDMLEYSKTKGKIPIALVGGGPSLKNTYLLDRLRKFRTIMVCGSAHDYLAKHNIIPTYATNCDPSPLSAGYFKYPHPETKYLMASNTDKKTMEALKGLQIVLWHCHSEALQNRILALEQSTNFRPYQAVCGGCTVGLRSISIAILLGYSNLHFFGFDSCMSDDGVDHHAYGWTDPEEEEKLIPKIHRIQFGPKNKGPDNTKHYYVAGYQLAQLDNFKGYYSQFKKYFTPTFHGGGALSDYYDLIIKLDKEQANEPR